MDNKFHDTGMSILSKQPDIGRMAVTGRKFDRYKFRTPPLRNIALTGPYMHNGSLKTLEAVVVFYNKGHAEVDEESGAIKMPALHLNDKEQAAIVAFLKSLTGDNVQTLIKANLVKLKLRRSIRSINITEQATIENCVVSGACNA